ncbi:putative histone deacetylase complex subunit (Hos4) [Aspergillus clavatus NRRL 1]|uniref:Ankyrin repeat protein n=1 Tax=Aspergillus clavatus (strain ATCC 1007 / CBS 513.65 / DSM 816 / NCTC 3887 / NRRL 1 / QM 1276 / 107) TaxID=344612 RepID=A1CRB9_ASPCL|nr:Ankyrin repeat protein [Aspergillus clavatus NRRL 1]EAW08190.1 Ankyrin repeat protein [Aspergillus clavatus NRRL 1]
MSDVDAFSSFPAALHAGQNAPSVTANPRSAPGQLPTKRFSSPSHHRGADRYTKEVESAAGEGDGPPSPKADSEAETIIQSGRESLSPEKRRKYIQHELKRRDHGDGNIHPVESSLPAHEPQVRKRKRSSDESSVERDLDGSPVLQSRRTNSPSCVKIEKPEDAHPSLSKIDSSQPPYHRETGISRESSQISRKRSHSDGLDGDKDRARPGRHSAAPRDKERRDINGIALPRPQSNDRSISPTRSIHKRTASGPQLGGTDIQKKRKAPTPLISGFQRQSSEDRQSVSSSTSGSPLPSAHLRRLTGVDGASASPARPSGHKKQRDQNGRTRLARACAAQELEVAIARHAERPEDLNVADNAGNTPLQIAALEGCAPIVKFLLEAGCDIDTKNIDRDTPLIDAVENGHLDVVKLLLEAGANPRTVNAEGDEPYDLVPSDSEDYTEIRRVLAEAKSNPRPSRRSEERAGSGNKETSSRRVSATSPRESPPVNGPRSPPLGIATKRKSVRSEATRNDLLWTKATPENLQAFAAKGDIAGVANILNVGQKADPESMIAAAKGGHDEVLSLLLGMGDADPDPEPVQGGNQKPGYNTPMLAAIGRGNLAVIRLLLDQPKFNPSRRLYRDRTYFELSRDRGADNWEEEYDLLRDAYDNYIRARRARKQDLPSPRRPRDREKENKRLARRESASPVASSRKAIRSPSAGHHRDSSSKDALSKDKRRDGVTYMKEKSGTNLTRPKVSHKNGDHVMTGSDHDGSRQETVHSKPSGAVAKDEDAPRRRRLIPGRPPQDRDRRRPSIPSSDSLSGREETVKPRVDHHTENPNVKHGPPLLKRGRSSASPERPHSRGRDSDHNSRDMQKKKRRVLSEDGTPNITNGGTKKTHEISPGADYKSIARPKKDESRLPDRERDRHVEISLPKVNDSKAVKQERERQETSHLADIPTEDARSAPKGPNPDPDELRRAEARRAERERLVEEERIAAEAQKAQLAKEEEERAARLAKEMAEEEERKQKEAEQKRLKQAEEERQKQLEQERLRLEKLRREKEEQEQRRREALPSRLRLAAQLVGSHDPQAKSHTWLKKFMPVVTAQTKQLDPFCDLTVANEKWVPNYLVAPLLATNDLQLSQYTSWEKRRATPTQRENLWRVTRRMLVQADETEFMSSSLGQVMQKDCETRPKYFDMEHVFWVRLSDFMDLVPHVPHLHGLDIQFLRMHIDQEPSEATPVFLARPNGHGPEPAPLDDANGIPVELPNLTNGYGHHGQVHMFSA